MHNGQIVRERTVRKIAQETAHVQTRSEDALQKQVSNLGKGRRSKFLSVPR